MQDPRVPLHLLEPECVTGLGCFGLRTRAFVETDPVAIKGQRAFEIGTVDVDVDDAMCSNRVLPHRAIIALPAAGRGGRQPPQIGTPYGDHDATACAEAGGASRLK